MGKTPRARTAQKKIVTRSLNSLKKLRKNNIPKVRESKAVAGIAHPIIARVWDGKKTLRQNFRAVGLSGDVNAPKPKVPRPLNEAEAAKAQGVVAELEQIVADHVPTTRFTPAGEVLFARQLVEKHGDDYQAMARDHKINVYQHTPKQLKKKIAKVISTLDLAEKHELLTPKEGQGAPASAVSQVSHPPTRRAGRPL